MYTLNWGPPVGITSVSEEFLELLDKDSKDLTEDARKDLAGVIKDEKYYLKEDYEKFINHLSPHINEYLNDVKSRAADHIDWSKLRWNLDRIWINRQHKNEYNPPHDHVGDISFVIYLNVPQEIYKEDPDIPELKWPGLFSFITGFNNFLKYGTVTRGVDPFIAHVQQQFDNRSQHTLQPKTGDMFLFPSYLTHTVNAFSADVERVSVSGNITLFNSDMVEQNGNR